MFPEVEAGLFQQLDGTLGIHVLVKGKAEVERPGARAEDEVVEVWRGGEKGGIGMLGGKVAVRSPDGYSKLDGLEQVDVASQGLVMIRGFVFKVADGSSNYARKLGILEEKRLIRWTRRSWGERERELRTYHADVGILCNEGA